MQDPQVHCVGQGGLQAREDIVQKVLPFARGEVWGVPVVVEGVDPVLRVGAGREAPLAGPGPPPPCPPHLRAADLVAQSIAIFLP